MGLKRNKSYKKQSYDSSIMKQRSQPESLY